jgi:hypothetical protein
MMAEERITTHDVPDAQATHTTIITDGESRRGGSGWFIGLVLLIALVVGIFMFTRMSGSETAKDNAITNAANEVGNAAGQVGDAAQQAGNAAQDAADNAANR